MKCKCKAKPKPDVTWFRGTTVVKESSKIKINVVDVEEDIYELFLEIKVPTLLYPINSTPQQRSHYFRIPPDPTVVPTGAMSKTNSAKVTPILI